MAEYPVKIEVKYEEKASRLEVLIVRWIYGIVLSIVMVLWGIAAGIAYFVQWWHILVLGKRHSGLFNFYAKYFRFYTRACGYLSLLTDERPPISGD